VAHTAGRRNAHWVLVKEPEGKETAWNTLEYMGG
jgi:hypothetical protein